LTGATYLVVYASGGGGVSKTYTMINTIEPQRHPTSSLLTNPAQFINATSGQVEYYTPPEIIEAARETMGAIELDPASSAIANSRIRAVRYFDESANGLYQPWIAETLWLNHPYGKSEQRCSPDCKKKVCVRRRFHLQEFKAGNAEWISKLVKEFEAGNVKQACCITFASTSEKWFRPLLRYAQCFLYGRTAFILPTGQPLKGNTKGSVVTYLGPSVEKFAAAFRKLGQTKVSFPG
jgi:hypothetical protein